jgi:hypothetical protein
MAMGAVDPQVLTEALKGIQAGSIAVLATLRVKFARDVTLGMLSKV